MMEAEGVRSQAHQEQSQTMNRSRLSTSTEHELACVPLRTQSGGFQTSHGTLYLSKPFRSASSNKQRAVISFVPRNSIFDPHDAAAPSEFRGFFTLFWISIFILVVQNYITSYERHGYPIEMAFAAMFSQHALALALSDVVLVLSSGFCVAFAYALKNGWLNYYHTGMIIQHTYQILVLATAITWSFNRKWPWVQSGFFTLHTLVLIMKMHSYMATNGYFQVVNQELNTTMESLRSATSRVGGWDAAIAETKWFTSSEESPTDDPLSSSDEGVEKCSVAIPQNARYSYIDSEAAQVLRKRLLDVDKERPMVDERAPTASVVLDPSKGYAKHAKRLTEEEFMVLTGHPDGEIAALARELANQDAELTGAVLGKVRWPDNIGIQQFADYMLIPSLVYELEYPRTEQIRPRYVLEKTVATFGTFALLYTMAENFILPLAPTKDQSFFRSLLDLALPFMISYLLLFYIIFECICNGFAELSYFADRRFYEDWVWNSTSWDEFARKWNKPVHAFLLRHVYASSISNYKLSKNSAMFVTFFLSACAHELVMAVVTKKIRMYLFAMQLFQIPLIIIGRIPAIKKNKVLGNVVFWLGLYAGFPLLCVAYCAY